MIGHVLIWVAITVARKKFPKVTGALADGIVDVTAAGLSASAKIVQATGQAAIEGLAKLGEPNDKSK